MPKPPITRRELSQVRTVLASGPDEVRQRVWCTRREQSVSTHECVECPRLAELQLSERGLITGLFCDAGAQRHGAADASSMELPMASVGTVMSKSFTCVRAELTLDVVTAIFLESDSQVLPVVDSQGTLLGFVRESDVQLEVHARCDAAEAEPRTVLDVMLPYPLLVPEHAQITEAAGTLVEAKQLHAGVVARDGSLVGVLSSEDILRWLAVAGAARH